jgi:hypothetical protein
MSHIARRLMEARGSVPADTLDRQTHSPANGRAGSNKVFGPIPLPACRRAAVLVCRIKNVHRTSISPIPVWDAPRIAWPSSFFPL